MILDKNKKYLITGGTGFLGKKLVNYLVPKGYQIRVLCRDEAKLVYLKEEQLITLTFKSLAISVT